MQIHLVRDADYPEEEHYEVLDFLTAFDGPVWFTGNASPRPLDEDAVHEEEFEEREFFSMVNFSRKLSEHCLEAPSFPVQRRVSTWKELFRSAAAYRRKQRVPPTDLVLLLTPVANELNWFCALDPANPNNGFIHTDEWEHYVHCSGTFPVVYHVVALALQRALFGSIEALQDGLHRVPLGCVNDFCRHKPEVILKLRTADVCLDCMDDLRGRLDAPVLEQLLNILEGVRTRMLFNQNFRQGRKPSALRITAAGRIFLPDYGNIEIRLTPLEKTLYLFFLQHPEGLHLHDLVDHRAELLALYGRFATSGMLAEIHNRVESLVNVRSNSASEKIARIKAAFVKAVGRDLAAWYFIRGEVSDVKKIHLEPALRTIDGGSQM
ncbi:hypothetical protein [Flaviaesturariibacter amylovorans]|uniref:Uncharacterized protein n=1 Tax=Flaviaesturariibacter amylovorans TaxID=1084520 RepID=A0ABP8G783_9BACT